MTNETQQEKETWVIDRGKICGVPLLGVRDFCESREFEEDIKRAGRGYKDRGCPSPAYIMFESGFLEDLCFDNQSFYEKEIEEILSEEGCPSTRVKGICGGGAGGMAKSLRERLGLPQEWQEYLSYRLMGGVLYEFSRRKS